MRFSLKWVLIGVTYVAVAAAAFSQETWVYADVLWLASLLAVVYAGLVAALARGRRQAAAAGFVAASVAFSLCVFVGSSSVPTLRLLTAAGVGPQSVAATAYPSPYYSPQPVSVIRLPVTVETMTPSGPVKKVTYVEEARVGPTPAATAVAAKPLPNPPQPLLPATPVAYAPPAYVDFSMYVRAGNAMGMMLLGGVGMLLGLLAFKAGRGEAIGAQQIAPGR